MERKQYKNLLKKLIMRYLRENSGLNMALKKRKLNHLLFGQKYIQL